MESQPWQYMIASIYILFHMRNGQMFLPKKMNIYIISVIFGIFFGFIFRDLILNFYTIRGLGNYIGIFIIYFTCYDIIKRYGLPSNVFYFANVIWLTFGLIEYFNFLDMSILVNSRTSSGRGVSSLATEPTFFAIQLFFFSLLYLIKSNYKLSTLESFLFLLNLFFVIFIARSSMGILFYVVGLIFLMLYMVLKQPILFLFIALFIYSLLLIIGEIQVDNSVRIFELYKLFVKDGLVLLFYRDGSLNGRLQDIVLPFIFFKENWGLPAGFNFYSQVEIEIASRTYDGFFWYQPGGNIIMSYVMSAVVELGLFGVLALWVLFDIGTRFSVQVSLEKTCIFVLLLAAVPLANGMPLIVLILLQLRKYTYKKLSV